MDINGKYRPFYIAKLLEELTDQDHYLTTMQISKLLEERYGMTSYRQTIAKDMEILRTVGMDIDCIPSTQNRYRLLSRRYSDSELIQMIGAIEVSRSITPESKENLINKLAMEAGVYRAETIKADMEKKRKPGSSERGRLTKTNLLALWDKLDPEAKGEIISFAERQVGEWPLPNDEPLEEQYIDETPRESASLVKSKRVSRKKLTTKQKAVYDYICREVKKKGYPPTVREICEHVGLASTSSAYGRLKALEEAGYIRRDLSKPRAIEICEEG